MTPSKYQTAAINWMTSGSGNAVISAVAGSGKTTLLLMMLKELFKEGKCPSVACLVFAKKNQVEMDYKLKREGIPAESYTVHSLCLRAYRKFVPNFKLEGRKVRLILEENLSSEDFSLYATACEKLVKFAKDDGAGIFWPIADAAQWQRLMAHHDVELENDATMDRAIEICQKTLEANNKEKIFIDFSDMIYLTLLNGYTLPKFDWVLVDEAQDLSPLRQAVCFALKGENTRFVFPGDRIQAVFGFTGADAESLDNIKSAYNATELPLSVCYRCSSSVVNHAKQWNPVIESAPNAETGSVTEMPYTALTEKPESLNLSYKDAILCRTNAPLMRTAFSLIKKGIPCRIEGRDIAQGLINVIGKWKVKTLDALENRLSDYLDRETQKAQTKGNEALVGVITDKVDCIRACMEKCYLEGKTRVDDLKALIDSMFSNADDKTTRRDLLTLCSVHKSKGLEWERVFLLGRQDFMPSKWAKKDWMKVQETNLIYVAITRAKRDLVEVTGVSEYLKGK
jgi:DNA helicase-2/ATP-dependent DNA helicase PcrA